LRLNIGKFAELCCDNHGRTVFLTAPDMALFDAHSTLKRLRNRYRLVVMNEDTYEEVVKFRLSRFSVYVVFSMLFIFFATVTVALIVFTPIKYYLPGVGYGNARQMREYKQLQIKADSIETALVRRQQYLDNLKKVLEGNVPKLDTNQLELPKAEPFEE
jgi:hypothetical protein